MAINNPELRAKRNFFVMMLNGVLIYGMLGRFFGPIILLGVI